MSFVHDIEKAVKSSVDKAIETEIDEAVEDALEDIRTKIKKKVSHIAITLSSMVSYRQNESSLTISMHDDRRIQ